MTLILHYAPDNSSLCVRLALEPATRANIALQRDRLEAAAADRAGWLAPGAATAHVCYLCPMLRWLGLYPAGATAWFDLSRWPHLLQIAKVTEAAPWAISSARAEGLGPEPFSAPCPPQSS